MAAQATAVPTASGGAIVNNGTLTVRYVRFENNTAYNSGGAIYNASGTALPFTGTFFVGNHTEFDGGALYNIYGAQMNVWKSAFYENGWTMDDTNNFGTSLDNLGLATFQYNCLLDGYRYHGIVATNGFGVTDARYNWWGERWNPNSHGRHGYNYPYPRHTPGNLRRGPSAEPHDRRWRRERADRCHKLREYAQRAHHNHSGGKRHVFLNYHLWSRRRSRLLRAAAHQRPDHD